MTSKRLKVLLCSLLILSLICLPMPMALGALFDLPGYDPQSESYANPIWIPLILLFSLFFFMCIIVFVWMLDRGSLLRKLKAQELASQLGHKINYYDVMQYAHDITVYLHNKNRSGTTYGLQYGDSEIEINYCPHDKRTQILIRPYGKHPTEVFSYHEKLNCYKPGQWVEHLADLNEQAQEVRPHPIFRPVRHDPHELFTPVTDD